jgi:YgiT-type zinc finger domain-containing protein
MVGIVSTTKCYECGEVMQGHKGEYKYVECGLNSVVLKDILVFHCPKCNEVVPEIPATGVLHWVIARRILRKKTLLTGNEIRFLRKLCGYSVNEFAEIMGSSKNVVCRWETASHGKGTDRLVRLLVMAKLCRKITGREDSGLKNITVDQLNAEIEATLKEIEAKTKNEKYEIPSEELARFSGNTQEAPEVASNVN